MDSFAFSLIAGMAQDALELAADFAEDADPASAQSELDNCRSHLAVLDELLKQADPARVRTRGNRSPQELKNYVAAAAQKFFPRGDADHDCSPPLQPIPIPTNHDPGTCSPTNEQGNH